MTAAVPIPIAACEETLTIMGVSLRVYVLEGKRRIIHADDLAVLFEAMEDGAPCSAEDAETLAQCVKGQR